MTSRANPRADTLGSLAFLGGMVAHNLLYPLSAGPGVWPLLFYIFFASLFVFGVFRLDQSAVLRRLIVVAALGVFVVGLANAYSPASWTRPALYTAAIAYHLVMVTTLVRFVFGDDVYTAVVVSATSLYLVLGSAFAPVFALIEWFEPGSFVTGMGAAVDWQSFLYFSYVTLTTLGYGDVTPQSFYAQAFATFEAVVGVLFTVLLLSRLVGIHAARPRPNRD